MKQLFILSFALLTLAACQNVDKNPKAPAVSPEQAAAADQAIVKDFGKVTDGEKVIITFHFKNTGTKPLVIANVQASCGCTVPSKPDEPIAPGQEGKITAEFNSAGRVGKASKYLNVTCNTKENVTNLLFEGEVLPKK